MKFVEKKRDRKPDLEEHMWNAHRVGDPIQCNIAPCQNKDFSTRGALKLHIMPGPEIALGTLAFCQQETKYGML